MTNNVLFCEYPDIVTVEDIQEMLRIGRNSVYDLLKKKSIKSITVGKKYIIPKQSVIDFVNTACNNSLSAL